MPTAVDMSRLLFYLLLGVGTVGTAGAKKLKLQPLDLQGKVRVVTITSFAALNQVLLCRRVLRLLIS